MFTGIIEDRGVIRSVQRQGEGVRIFVTRPKSWRVSRGASVALDGICLTSVGAPRGDLVFDLMGETLSKTTAKYFKIGRCVNLERPLRSGSEVGGHFVQGHIDSRARVIDVSSGGKYRKLTIEVPARFVRLVAEIGSISINGVSLTVSKKVGKRITVSLIPHTLERTNLRDLKKGDEVNVEFDVLARYLAALSKK